MAQTEKTRNGKRWTESRFRQFIFSALRGAFRRWGPKADVLADAFTRVKKNKASNRKAKHYRCASCGKEFPRKQMSVDHVKAIGHTDSWDEFVEKLFCEQDNLQTLCRSCHAQKTKKERTK